MPETLEELRAAVDAAQEKIHDAEAEHVEALHRWQLARDARREAHYDAQRKGIVGTKPDDPAPSER